MADDVPDEGEVLRRMLASKPKPHEKQSQSGEGKQRGRPVVSRPVR